MAKLNSKNGITISIILVFLAFIGFYSFKILAFAAQGGSGYKVKNLFHFLLFLIEFIGIYGVMAPLIGVINDFSQKPKVSWTMLTSFSLILALIIFLITRHHIGL